jgi:hypothetical protein
LDDRLDLRNWGRLEQEVVEPLLFASLPDLRIAMAGKGG